MYSFGGAQQSTRSPQPALGCIVGACCVPNAGWSATICANAESAVARFTAVPPWCHVCCIEAKGVGNETALNSQDVVVSTWRALGQHIPECFQCHGRWRWIGRAEGDLEAHHPEAKMCRTGHRGTVQIQVRPEAKTELLVEGLKLDEEICFAPEHDRRGCDGKISLAGDVDMLVKFPGNAQPLRRQHCRDVDDLEGTHLEPGRQPQGARLGHDSAAVGEICQRLQRVAGALAGHGQEGEVSDLFRLGHVDKGVVAEPAGDTAQLGEFKLHQRACQGAKYEE
ncbi:hypothetical protein N7462_005943 [Penicillium macrosclerotiorum]|uniref:uncharacterized protein n=1 Tax=Penicillium macrosclerotiorum TaxID=303699 RepID=UPI002548CD67|nr:uncharacterized protein N7462_005943 [Penicillium macrosclerotiorum]KAJ5682778.1 hypothetical protein N7462_005943 [Penicillium macrosclerotiorum]